MKEETRMEAWRKHAKAYDIPKLPLPKKGPPCPEVGAAVTEAMARLPYKLGKHRAVRSAIVYEVVYEDGTVFTIVTENRTTPLPRTMRATLDSDGSPLLMGYIPDCLNGTYRSNHVKEDEGGCTEFFHSAVRYEEKGEHGVARGAEWRCASASSAGPSTATMDLATASIPNGFTQKQGGDHGR